jgi:hypothetical protein
MTTTHAFLGSARALVGIGSWLAPDLTARVFGIDPERSNRFIARLFGARDLALGAALLAAPPRALPAVAAVGVAIDSIDSVAGFDEYRRGNLSTQATVLGPGGAVAFAILGAIVASEARAAASGA